MIRAVFLDVDQTLVDFDASAARAHEGLFGDTDGYSLWCASTPRFWARFTSGELDFATMREARMAHYLNTAGLDPGTARETEQRRWELVERGFEPYPDVLDTLEALRGMGLALGVITNNESVHQRRKLATVGLSGAFDAVVISGEVGVAKPDQAIFAHACAAAGVAAAEAVHVGDLLDLDARAARDAGLSGVWLDRTGAGAPDPDVEVIRSLSELPALVAAVGSGQRIG